MTANRPDGPMPRPRVLSGGRLRLWAMIGGSLLLAVALSLVAANILERQSGTGGSAVSSSAQTMPEQTMPETPSVEPSPTNCAEDLSGCGFPHAGNTGVPAGTKLAVVKGNLDVRKAGAVVSGKDIRGCVRVHAKNVTIRRSKITCIDFYAIASFAEDYKGGGLLVEDVEIDCKNSNGNGLGSYGFTAVRLEIRGCENGFDVSHDATIVDSYVHDLYEGDTGHADGAQLSGGANIDIRHNTIFVFGGTAAIISHPSGNSNVLIEGNLMAGGAYTVYCPRDSSVDFRVLDNRFSTIYYEKGGAYGPWTDCTKVVQAQGNVWDRDLQLVALY